MSTEEAVAAGGVIAPAQALSGGSDDGDLVLAAQAALRNGNPEQAAALYGMALEGLHPGHTRYAALLGLAGAQCDAGRLDLAECTCRSAVGESPAIHTGHAMLASVLLDLGRLDEAAEAVQAALRRSQRDPQLLNLATGIALRRGRAAEARDLAQRCLAQSHADQRALAHLAIALAQLGCDRDVAWLLDFGKLLKVTMAGTPAGFASTRAFNRTLVDSLVNRPDLSYRHTARTMVGGARLNDSFVLDPLVAEPLRRIFTDAVASYLADLEVGSDHPFLAGKPEAMVVTSWANIMDEGAFELPHMHEGAWLSGVYYPEVTTPSSTADDAGAIEFGGHDFNDVLPFTGPTRRIVPVPGMLVLFPSYFYHRTIPFAGRGRRISIAYDASPAR